MDDRVIIQVPPDLLGPYIEQAIERVLDRRYTVGRIEAALSDQLLYSEKQAAKKLGLTPAALRDERLKGRIQFLQRGRQVKYLPEHLAAYVDSWKNAAESESANDERR